jgi:tellurite resistance protein
MIRIIAALLLTTAIATPAEARRGGGSAYAEKLVIVAPTEFTSETGAPLALCHLFKDQTAMLIPYHRSSQGYAIAENNCDTESYFPFTAEELAGAQLWGKIDASIPTVPQISTFRQIINFGVIGLVGLLLVGGLGAALLGSLGKSKKVAGHKVDPKRRAQLLEAVVDVMCHVALVDGDVDQTEINEIGRIYRKLTNTPIKQAQISAQFSTIQGPVNIAGLSAASEGKEREVLLQAAMMVAVTDGKIDQAEYNFICNMAQGFGLDGGAMRGILAKMLGEKKARSSTRGFRMDGSQPA